MKSYFVADTPDGEFLGQYLEGDIPVARFPNQIKASYFIADSEGQSFWDAKKSGLLTWMPVGERFKASPPPSDERETLKDIEPEPIDPPTRNLPVRWLKIISALTMLFLGAALTEEALGRWEDLPNYLFPDGVTREWTFPELGTAVVFKYWVETGLIIGIHLSLLAGGAVLLFPG